MAKYFFIGSINESKSPRGGAEAKNQFLLEKLKVKLGANFTYVDTSGSENSFLKISKLIYGLIFNEHIILSIASTGLEKLSFFNFLFRRKKLTIFIIGGMVDEKLGNRRLKKLFELADISYAETHALSKSIKSKSAKINVLQLPNFKDLIPYLPNNKSNKDNIIRLVYLSRIHVNKGVFKSIELVEKLNEAISDKEFILDLYGPLDLPPTELEKFNERINNENINYKGFLDLNTSNGYSILSGYHFFVFLTNHPGEGFPGVLIDAMHAKTHLIYSDWKYNHEIVSSNGFLVNMESSFYQNEIIAYIRNILNKEEQSYLDELNQIEISSRKYDSSNINFEIA